MEKKIKQASHAAHAVSASAAVASNVGSSLNTFGSTLDPQTVLMAKKLAESTGNPVQIVQMPGGAPAAVILQSPGQAHLPAGMGVFPSARFSSPIGLTGVPMGLAPIQSPSTGVTLAVTNLATIPMEATAASGSVLTLSSPHLGIGDLSGGAGQSGTGSSSKRETLSRRPSYRKIFNDISADGSGGGGSHGISRGESKGGRAKKLRETHEELDGGSSTDDKGDMQGLIGDDLRAPAAQLVGIQLAQGLHQQASGLAIPGQPTAILQYAQQGPDGQFYIPANALQQVAAYQVAAANATANAIQPAGILVTGPSGNVVQNSNTPQPQVVSTNSLSLGVSGVPLSVPGMIGGPPDESNRKREVRLQKNREAARECRKKKKQYVQCLETRVMQLETQNKQLIEELKTLKELYCSKQPNELNPGSISQPSSQPALSLKVEGLPGSPIGGSVLFSGSSSLPVLTLAPAAPSLSLTQPVLSSFAVASGMGVGEMLELQPQTDTVVAARTPTLRLPSPAPAPSPGGLRSRESSPPPTLPSLSSVAPPAPSSSESSSIA